LKGLYLEGSAQLVTGPFPTCWEVEVIDNESVPGPKDRDEPGDVYAWYVA
jgi:hypothetical protein